MPSWSTAFVTTFPFLAALMAHKRWRAGKPRRPPSSPRSFRAASIRRCRRARSAAVLAAVAGSHRSRAGRAQAPHSRPGQRQELSRARAAARSGSARTKSASKSGARTAPSRCAFPSRAKRPCAIWPPTGSRATPCGPAPSTANRSRCRCARSPMASRSATAASRRKHTSIPRARPNTRG